MTDPADPLIAYIRLWTKIIIISNVISIVATAAIVFVIARYL